MAVILINRGTVRKKTIYIYTYIHTNISRLRLRMQRQATRIFCQKKKKRKNRCVSRVLAFFFAISNVYIVIHKSAIPTRLRSARENDLSFMMFYRPIARSSLNLLSLCTSLILSKATNYSQLIANSDNGDDDSDDVVDDHQTKKIRKGNKGEIAQSSLELRCYEIK